MKVIKLIEPNKALPKFINILKVKEKMDIFSGGLSEIGLQETLRFSHGAKNFVSISSYETK